MLNFENDFTFKIPVQVGGIKWTMTIPEIEDTGDGMATSGKSTTIQLVNSSSSTATVFATSDVTISSSGIFPETTLSITKPYSQQIFTNKGIYLKLVGNLIQ